MKFPFNILGRPVSGEAVCKEQDWSAILTENGYAIANPDIRWATRPISEYLIMEGECGRLDDGTLHLRFYDPPEADYPFNELLVLPIAFLSRDFVEWLRKNVPPWEQPVELSEPIVGDFPTMTESQSETLARIPAAFLAHQQKLGSGPAGFPKLPAAPPKRGVTGFRSGGSEDDSPK